jgi:hypothetical protein
MGQKEMKCIFNIGKNISIWAKVTQVSDVAHGPLVRLLSCSTTAVGFRPFHDESGTDISRYYIFIIP